MTDLASVMNQVDVKGKLLAGGNVRFDEVVRLCIATFFGQNFHAAQDTKDMRVHWKNGLRTSKEQDTTRRFRADAFERSEERQGFPRCEVVQKR